MTYYFHSITLMLTFKKLWIVSVSWRSPMKVNISASTVPVFVMHFSGFTDIPSWVYCSWLFQESSLLKHFILNAYVCDFWFWHFFIIISQCQQYYWNGYWFIIALMSCLKGYCCYLGHVPILGNFFLFFHILV